MPSLQTRLINEQEIFYAVFYTSTSTFCNPSVPAPSIPIQVPLLPSRKLHNSAQIAVASLAGETPQLPRATATPPSPKPATSSNPKPVLLAGRSGGPSKIAALGFKTRNRVFDIFDLDNEPTDNLITQPLEAGKAIEQRIVPPDPQPQPRRRIFSYDISQPEVKSQAFLKPNQKFVEWTNGSESEMDDPENVGRPPIASLATRALIKEAAVAVMSEKRIAEPEDGEGESLSHGAAAKKRPIPCNAAPPELVLSPTTTVHQGEVAKLSKQLEQDAEVVQNFEHAKTKKWTVEKARTADSLDEEDLGSVKNEKDAQKNMVKVEVGNLVVRNEPPGRQPRKWTEGNGGRPHDNGRINFKRFQKARYAGMGGQRITIIKMVPHESETLGTGANESWLKSSGESSSNTNSAKQKSCKQSEESRDEDMMLEREPPAKRKPRKKSEQSDDEDFLSKRKPPVKRRSRKQSEDDEDFVPKKKEPPAKKVCTRAKQKHDDSLTNREPPKTPKQWTVQEMIGDDDDEGFGPFTPK
ncbi:hypothetical protein BC936DRAFT_140814 [Jimgerdemannia flammicorona]|uniref:Uncharacterized protein n=1 Tax=Jimgerdemannia flammicorona TaxID=994334 RepID=A0A433DGI7_9FUNG|nr:hypothetical protein BC936DRAFT_140814 [Jimgerdemannia flammicorona]